MADARISIEDYDPGWPGRFAAQRVMVERLLAPWLAGRRPRVATT